MAAIEADLNLNKENIIQPNVIEEQGLNKKKVQNRGNNFAILYLQLERKYLASKIKRLQDICQSMTERETNIGCFIIVRSPKGTIQTIFTENLSDIVSTY